MAGSIASGTALVLVSWAAALLVLVGLGLAVARATDRTARLDASIRGSLWWGLALMTCVVLALGLTTPLGDPRVLGTILALAGLLALLGVVLLVRGQVHLPRPPRPTPGTWALVAAFGAAAIYLAFKAIGPATNYDTGLYHLGAIKYAADFTTIPGLATLYFPFGYSNAQFPLAAALGSGPWGPNGFRLLNGLLVAAVMLDVMVRLWWRRYSWGTFILAIGLGAVLVPLVALSDYLVTSPTADTAILLLTLVSTAYLADFLGSRRERSMNASVVAVTVLLMVSMRPTMVFFAAGAALVVVASLLRQRSWPGVTRAGWLAVGSLTVALGLLQVLRDRLLSGWLLYPLSVFSFDVPWRTDDPTSWREATLASARDSSNPDQYSVAHSWSWIPVWIGRLWTQWETYFVLVGFIVALVAVLVARRTTGFPRHPRRIVAVMAPSALAVVTWFTVSPPSFRFIWGPLFCLPLIPLGAALQALHNRERSMSVPVGSITGLILGLLAGVVLLTTAYSAAARNQADTVSESSTWSVGPISVQYAVAPLPRPPVAPITMTSGLVLFTPVTGDQCWDNYPLCTFSMGDNIALRGPTLQDGFTRQ